MASNAAPTVDDELVHEFSPLLRVYKSGRIEGLFVVPPIAPGIDPSTGVESKDVNLGIYSARLYLPPSAATTGAKLPVMVYIHGGAFVAESAKSPHYHRFLNDLASACPALCVSVDYRLAPEHPLPAAYDDCLAALGWVLSAGDTWIVAHGDLSRVFVAGDSAGGNICHHLAIQPDAARLNGAVLIHPWFWGSEAVGEETRDPAERAHVAGLDRVMVCTAEGDFVRWRGRAYSEAVTAARGVGEHEVELLETEGEEHVFYLFKPDCDKAKEMLHEIVALVNAAWPIATLMNLVMARMTMMHKI
ncbi:unnamed protein product [Alopecurus aequalis]